MRTLTKYTIIAAALLLAASPVRSQDIQFSVSADKTSVTLGEQIVVTAQVTSTKKLGSITPPKVPKSEDFDVAGTNQNQSSSTSIQVINGKMTQSVTMTYLFYYSIVPKKTGSFTFPALLFSSDGNDYASNPFVITVGKEPPQAASEVKASLMLNKKSLFVGEQAILTVQVAQKAGSQVQLTQQALAELYDKTEKALGKDFSVVRLFSQLPSKGVTQIIGGENYFVVKVEYAIFPLNAGDVRIPGVPFQYVTLKRVQGRRFGGGGGFFDDFFSDNFFGGGVEQVARSVVSNSLDVHVTSLPEPPADFSGAVGSSFKLNASVDPREVPAGEAATITCSVNGTTRPGSLGDIALGELPECSIFAPEKHISVDTTASGIVSRKTYKYLLIPKQEGGLAIPPLSWSYFDPIARIYKKLSSDTLRLMVTKGKAGPAVQSRYLTQEEIRQVGQDIHFIKTGVKIRQQSAEYYKNPVFVFLYLLPLAIALFSLLYKLQAQRYAKDASLVLRQKALRRALGKLSAIEKQATTMGADVFLGKIADSLDGYISEKFGFSASGKVLADLRQELSGRGVEIKLAEDIIAFLERMDVYRFGAASLDASQRASMVESTRGFIRNLDRTRKGKPS
jgi:hypothetical protein